MNEHLKYKTSGISDHIAEVNSIVPAIPVTKRLASCMIKCNPFN